MNSLLTNNTKISPDVASVARKLMEGFLPLLEKEKIVIIHSALSKLGFPKSDAYLDGVLHFLNQLVDEGKTVVLPSFTFSFSKRKEYAYTDPSETGRLADLAQQQLHFTRTNNPMFSFVVAGPQKELFLNTRSDTGYGEGTAVSKLISDDLAVVMLGAAWDCCTVIHAVEERQQVPYRAYVTWNYPVDFGEGPKEHSFTAFVRDHKYNTTLNFGRIRDVLSDHHELRTSKLNGITLEAANGKTIATLATQMILKDPFYFVTTEKN